MYLGSQDNNEESKTTTNFRANYLQKGKKKAARDEDDVAERDIMEEIEARDVEELESREAKYVTSTYRTLW
jgi:hypothetical protein